MASLLIVDDDEQTVKWMVPALEARGHVVRAFAHPSAALAALEAWTPELILTDIMMPEVDGLSFARLIRRWYGVPIMFVSIAASQAEAVVSGASGYVQKPATPQEIRAAIDRVLARSAQRSTILVVDDDAATRQLHRAFLEPAFAVLEAEHGEAALRVLAANPVDLAIVDVHMPVMNGVELIRRMRSDPALVRVPVIVQTADRSALATRVWRELQVAQVIHKEDFLDWLSQRIDAHVWRP
jgi:CheY-like chemotaxis protein